MSNKVNPFSTQRSSHIAVRKSRRGWEVEIVTPVPGRKPLRTSVAARNCEAIAYDYAKQTANRMGLPFKTGGA